MSWPMPVPAPGRYGKGPLHKEILGNMRYETRLKRSFDNSDEKLLLVAFDGEKRWAISLPPLKR